MPFARDLGPGQRAPHDNGGAVLPRPGRGASARWRRHGGSLTRLLIGICEQLQEEEQRWRPDLPAPARRIGSPRNRRRAPARLCVPSGTIGSWRSNNAFAMHRAPSARASGSSVRTRSAPWTRPVCSRRTWPTGRTGLRLPEAARAVRRLDGDEKANTMKVLASGKWHAAKATPSRRRCHRTGSRHAARRITTAEAARADGELHRQCDRVRRAARPAPTAALHLLDEELEEDRNGKKGSSSSATS